MPVHLLLSHVYNGITLVLDLAPYSYFLPGLGSHAHRLLQSLARCVKVFILHAASLNGSGQCKAAERWRMAQIRNPVLTSQLHHGASLEFLGELAGLADRAARSAEPWSRADLSVWRYPEQDAQEMQRQGEGPTQNCIDTLCLERSR